MEENTQSTQVAVTEKKGTAIPAPMKIAMSNIISDMYLKGYSYRQMAKKIAEEFPRTISIVTVGNIIKALIKEWKDERVNAMDDLKAVELKRINKLEQEYWDAWEKSKTAKERRIERQHAFAGTIQDEDGRDIPGMKVMKGEKTTSTEENFGDPRFLEGIKWCIALRCKILGIEAPIEVNATLTSNIKTKTIFNTRIRVRPKE